MAEDPMAKAATLTPPFTHSPAAALRLISFLNRTPPEPDHFLDLDEGDVIWSPTSPSTSLSPPRGRSPRRLPLSPDCCRAFAPEKFGLSAVLAESDGPTVRRRSSAPLAVPSHPTRGNNVDRAPPLGQSAPVNVPMWTRRSRQQKGSFFVLGEEKEEEDDEEEEWVPPHLMVARSHVTTFSMFEGAGRTLKGRDLRRVRNAIWRQTGFLD